MLNFILGIVKLISGLNTAAKQLLAVLLTVLLLALATIVYLFDELMNTPAQIRKEHAIEMAEVRSQAAKNDERHEKEKDVLRAEIATVKREQYEFITNLYQEQKRLNGTGIGADNEMKRLAKINRRHVSNIKKDAKDLIEVTNKSTK